VNDEYYSFKVKSPLRKEEIIAFGGGSRASLTLIQYFLRMKTMNPAVRVCLVLQSRGLGFPWA
jgi:hypothetical protein